MPDSSLTGANERQGAAGVVMVVRAPPREEARTYRIRPGDLNSCSGVRSHTMPCGAGSPEAAVEYGAATFPDAEITVLHAIDPIETHFGEG